MVHSSHQMLVKMKHCTFSHLIFAGMHCCLKSNFSTTLVLLVIFNVHVSIYYPVIVRQIAWIKVPMHLTAVFVLLRNQGDTWLGSPSRGEMFLNTWQLWKPKFCDTSKLMHLDKIIRESDLCLKSFCTNQVMSDSLLCFLSHSFLVTLQHQPKKIQ